MKMSEEVVTFVFFTYFSQNFLEGGRTTKIAELINEAVVARATKGRLKTTLTSSWNSKGQKILKANYSVLNSPKKRTKNHF